VPVAGGVRDGEKTALGVGVLVGSAVEALLVAVRVAGGAAVGVTCGGVSVAAAGVRPGVPVGDGPG
jgi:hypothetical protein